MIHTKTILKLIGISILSVTGLMVPAALAATEISLPEIAGKPGQVIELPITINEIDNLAGLKLVIRYDASVLTYKNASPTKHGSPLMHIVNDKKPGTLIIVMAGARGIKGKHFSIFDLVFQIRKNTTVGKKSSIKIVESQLMSDKLKNIKHIVKNSTIVISKDGE